MHLSRYTTGFTGADLENLLNEAALIAARRNRKDISMAEVEEAFDRIIVGTQKKSRIISEAEKRIVAYHEAGHAIIGYHARECGHGSQGYHRSARTRWRLCDDAA